MYLFLFSAFIQVVKGHQNIFGKSGCKYIFGCSELMSWLAYDGINDIKSGNFVLGSAFLDEFFHALHNMLVIFDCPDSPLSDGRHFSLGNGRLNLVQRRELKIKVQMKSLGRYVNHNSWATVCILSYSELL